MKKKYMVTLTLEIESNQRENVIPLFEKELISVSEDEYNIQEVE